MALVPRQDGDVIVWNEADETYYYAPFGFPCQCYTLYNDWYAIGDDPSWYPWDGTYYIELDRLPRPIPSGVPVTLMLGRFFNTEDYPDNSPTPTVEPFIDGQSLGRWTHPIPDFTWDWDTWEVVWNVPSSIYSSWIPGQTLELFMDKDNAFVMYGELCINCVGAAT